MSDQLKLKQSQIRKWQLSIRNLIQSRNGDIISAILLWKQNIDNEMEGTDMIKQARDLCETHGEFGVYVEKRAKLPNGGWSVVVRDKVTNKQYKSVQSNHIGPDDTLISTVEKQNIQCKKMWDKHCTKAHAASGQVIDMRKRPAATEIPEDIPESAQNPAPNTTTKKKRKKKLLKKADTPAVVPKPKKLKRLKKMKHPIA